MHPIENDGDVLNNRRKLALSVTHRLNQIYGYPQWRNPMPALDELVSTILSQNTNDRNRDTAFYNLKNRFPTWESVRDAPSEQIINAIRSAGLANQKGPRIQSILKAITIERGSLDLTFLENWEIEKTREWLMHFNGVGPKTAAIVLCFSLGKPAFPVDTHIHRVTGRLHLRDASLNAEKAHQYLESVFPKDCFYSAHLNLIRLGREFCHPRKPECAPCPLNRICPSSLIPGESIIKKVVQQP
jgi:endonuclease-3